MNLTLKKLIPDRLYIYFQYRKNLGHFPNLKNPVSFNEKMQWLKLYDRKDVQTQISDKYESRFYIEKVIGNQYLIPLVYQTYEISDEIYENIPDYPCVLKTNQDCGGVVFVSDKKSLNWPETKGFLEERFEHNHYYYAREWQYKNIKPCVIIEKLLLKKDGDIPYDYKVYCFNGKAKMIAVDQDRDKPTKARNWYDMDWQKHDIFWNTPSDDRVLPKPAFFDEMIELSERLAKDFYFLRVDWYDVDGNLYNGELTLHPGGGMVHFYPLVWEKILGDYLQLPTDH